MVQQQLKETTGKSLPQLGDQNDVQRFIGNHFMTPEGAKVKQILEKLFYHRLSYTKGDSHQTAFHEGEREVVAYLINCVAFATVKKQEELKIAQTMQQQQGANHKPAGIKVKTITPKEGGNV